MKNICTKLLAIKEEIPKVAKRGHNSFHHYDYATEADILATVNPILNKYKVFVYPDVTQYEKDGVLTTIKVDWTFVDTDSGEYLRVAIPGTGEDKGDKGLYKALTGSQKYALTDVLGIATGDDPEKDEKPNKIIKFSQSDHTKPLPDPAPVELGYVGELEKLFEPVEPRANAWAIGKNWIKPDQTFRDIPKVTALKVLAKPDIALAQIKELPCS